MIKKFTPQAKQITILNRLPAEFANTETEQVKVTANLLSAYERSLVMIKHSKNHHKKSQIIAKNSTDQSNTQKNKNNENLKPNSDISNEKYALKLRNDKTIYIYIALK